MYILISILNEDWVWVSKNLRPHVQKQAKKEERKRESDWRDDRKTRARDRLGAAIDPQATIGRAPKRGSHAPHVLNLASLCLFCNHLCKQHPLCACVCAFVRVVV